MDGALLIDKPIGISSFAVIARLQRALKQRLGCTRRELPKMGHGGTLDPFASGLLMVCVGRGVKLSRYFLGSQKTYSGEIVFGSKTASADHMTDVIEATERLPSSLQEIAEAANTFVGREYWQVPPMYSAKKIDGQALYKRARRGEMVERAAELRVISEFTIPRYEAPVATFRVSCSSGTYVRTLAENLAELLHSLAHLQNLRRECSGSWSVQHAWELDNICAAEGEWSELPCWVPFNELPRDLLKAQVDADVATALRQGKQQYLGQACANIDTSALSDQPLALHNDTELIGTVRYTDNAWHIERMFQ